MPLKIHAGDDTAAESPVTPKTVKKVVRKAAAKKPKASDRPATPLPADPYLVLFGTLGKRPRLESFADLKQLAAAMRKELQTSLPDDVRMFAVKGELMPVTVVDGAVHIADGASSIVIRPPVPPPEAEVIKTTGEFIAVEADDPVSTGPVTGSSDDDFLFA